MNSLRNIMESLWWDEAGLLISAEAVTVGTVGVLTAVVGMNAIGSAVDSELKEMAIAIRSLDQSYIYSGHRGCGAWTAGSYYIQPNVEKSVSELYPDSESDLKAIQKRIDDERKAFAKPPTQIPRVVEPAPEPKPNQIPTPENKPAAPAAEAANPQ